jgi:electron transfer flavoprotein beta subunit
MRIVVCLKQVPDTTDVKLDPVTHTLIREGTISIPNPYDMHALTEAVRLKKEYGGEVTVLSMGPPMAKTALQKAVSYGADEAILLTDRAFAGSDTLATSAVLSAAVAKLSPDLVFCGKQAIDGDTAQVGPGIATRLNLSLLTYVSKVREVNLKERYIIVERKLEEGIEVIKAALPAMLTTVKEINSLLYANLPDLLRSLEYEPKLWTNADLGLDAKELGLTGSPTSVVKTFAPPLREAGSPIPPTDENINKLVQDLSDFLKTQDIRCI